jgi:hypothetical protein
MMASPRHIDHADALAAAENRAGPEVLDHLEGCPRCRRLVADFERLMGVLISSASAPSLPAGLSRWAAAYGRIHSPRNAQWSVLGLLSRGPGPATALRGELSSVALLFGDDRHQLDVRIDRDGEQTRLHGHIVPLSGDGPSAWRITLISGAGRTRHIASDDRGEFWVDGLGAWQSHSLVAEAGRERLVVARLGDGLEGGGR